MFSNQRCKLERFTQEESAQETRPVPVIATEVKTEEAKNEVATEEAKPVVLPVVPAKEKKMDMVLVIGGAVVIGLIAYMLLKKSDGSMIGGGIRNLARL